MFGLFKHKVKHNGFEPPSSGFIPSPVKPKQKPVVTKTYYFIRDGLTGYEAVICQQWSHEKEPRMFELWPCVSEYKAREYAEEQMRLMQQDYTYSPRFKRFMPTIVSW